MSLIEKLGPICARHEELGALMAAGNLSGEAYGKLASEYAELSPVVEAINAYRAALSEREGLEPLLSDADMRDMARADLERLNALIPALETDIRKALIPKDKADARNAILEIRAGTGGDEAALFAADLFAMYRGYAARRGWRLEVLDASESDLGGYREIICEVGGHDVFGRLKYESGVHRVQRVPVTEAGGRIHTSAATVAVLPEAEEVDVRINEGDLRVDTYRSQGSGGQHVNKTESAVRITHLPSGIVVAMQEEKSQHKNREKAMKILRSKLYEAEWTRRMSERSADRKLQVGSGDRSERIRTYNFPQGRVTDHRINLTLYKIADVLNGTALDEVIEPLIAEDQADSLAALE